MVVSAMPNSTEKRRQQRQTSGRQESFEQLLATETKKLEDQKNLDGKTITYARNGQIFIGHALSRAYN